MHAFAIVCSSVGTSRSGQPHFSSLPTSAVFRTTPTLLVATSFRTTPTTMAKCTSKVRKSMKKAADAEEQSTSPTADKGVFTKRWPSRYTEVVGGKHFIWRLKLVTHKHGQVSEVWTWQPATKKIKNKAKTSMVKKSKNKATKKIKSKAKISKGKK